ncbi:MAG: S8 family serine peptidase [Opitutales bacterium]|nr:S8 family serine peptidase [Opitutales bacterium]
MMKVRFGFLAAGGLCVFVLGLLFVFFSNSEDRGAVSDPQARTKQDLDPTPNRSGVEVLAPSKQAWIDRLDRNHPPEGRWNGSELLELRHTFYDDDAVIIRREMLIQPSSRKELIRIDEKWSFDVQSDTFELENDFIAVADRLLVVTDNESLVNLIKDHPEYVVEAVSDYGIFSATSTRPRVSLDLLPDMRSELGRLSSGFEAVVEPDFVVKKMVSPNDTNLGQQYYLAAGSASAGSGRIQAPDAWDVRRDASSVIVAIVDSGIDTDHPDLVGNLWSNPSETADGQDNDGNGLTDDIVGADFVDRDGNPQDGDGHGTHVAGTVGAQGNNSRGVTGVAWDVQLMSVRVLDDEGSGTILDIVNGLDYAREKGADIINLSLGSDSFSSSLSLAMSRLDSAGIIAVAAAGNESRNTDFSPAYPASYSFDNIISVAASDSGDNLAGFSNYGANSVDLAAPGDLVYATYLNGGYEFLSGTSMATPVVAGAFALLKAESPNATDEALIERLLQSVDLVNDFNLRTVTGGRLNLFRALNFDQLDGAPVLSAVESNYTAAEGQDLNLSFSASGPGTKTFTLRFGNQLLGSNTSGDFILSNVDESDSGTYLITVSNVDGSDSESFEVSVSSSSEALENALDVGESALVRAVTTEEAEPWSPTSSIVYSGSSALRSNDISNSESSSFTAVIEGPATVNFFWKVSSEEDYDFLKFSVDGVLVEEISGDVDWTAQSLTLESGTHTLLWTYSKDFSVSSGLDAGFVDALTVFDGSVSLPEFTFESPDLLPVAGSNVAIVMEVSGSEPLSFQWLYNNEIFSGDVTNAVQNGVGTSTLSINGVSSSNAGAYVLRVINPAGAIFSRTVRLSVQELEAPTIVNFPSEVTAQTGGTLSLQVSASGSDPKTYVWSKDDTEVATTTIPVYTVTDVNEAVEGAYRVTVSNEAGSVQSGIAQVAVVDVSLLPSITKQPQSTTGFIGGSVSFSVTVTGVGPITFQWFRDDLAIQGAENANLELNELSLSDAGVYYIEATNVFGSTQSFPVNLSVQAVDPQILNAGNVVGMELSNDTSNQWTVTSTTSFFGGSAIQAGAIPDDSATSLMATVEGPGLIEFAWRVSSEASFDFFSFNINGVERSSISGDSGWQRYKAFIEQSGAVTLEWEYSKDGFIVDGQDTAWVDQMSFISADELAPSVIAFPSTWIPGVSEFEESVSIVGAQPITYVVRNEGAIVYQDTSLEPFFDSLSANGDGYWVLAQNAIGSMAVGFLNVPIVSNTDVLDNSGSVSLNSPNSWVVSSGEFFRGGSSLASNDISDDQITSVTFDVTGPGTLSFQWRVSSEEDYDFLYIADDDGEVYDEISGLTEWSSVSIDVPPGTQTFSIFYEKDGSVSRGEDRGWIDSLIFEESAASSAFLRVSTDVGSGFQAHPEFGSFYGLFYPWVKLEQLGILYIEDYEPETGRLIAYDQNLGALQITSDSQPYAWHYATSSWVYFYTTEDGKSYAYHFGLGQWLKRAD